MKPIHFGTLADATTYQKSELNGKPVYRVTAGSFSEDYLRRTPKMDMMLGIKPLEENSIELRIFEPEILSPDSPLRNRNMEEIRIADLSLSRESDQSVKGEYKNGGQPHPFSLSPQDSREESGTVASLAQQGFTNGDQIGHILDGIELLDKEPTENVPQPIFYQSRRPNTYTRQIIAPSNIAHDPKIAGIIAGSVEKDPRNQNITTSLKFYRPDYLYPGLTDKALRDEQTSNSVTQEMTLLTNTGKDANATIRYHSGEQDNSKFIVPVAPSDEQDREIQRAGITKAFRQQQVKDALALVPAIHQGIQKQPIYPEVKRIVIPKSSKANTTRTTEQPSLEGAFFRIGEW